MSDGIVYAGPEGIITATTTGYIVEDDGGEVEGEFASLADAHATLGSTPPAYPDAMAGPGIPVSEGEPAPALSTCEHCGGAYEDLKDHHRRDGLNDSTACVVLFGPRDDFADLREGARRQREYL